MSQDVLVTPPLEPDGFEALVAAHGPACLASAARVLGDRHLAEDAVQEALLDAWRLRSRFDPTRGTQRSWLLMLTHRRAVDRVRAEHRQAVPLADVEPWMPPSDRPAPVDLAWQAEQARAVHRALPDLSAPQRQVLVLAYFGGYNQSEIAVLVGIPLGTVKTRTAAAKRALRALLPTALGEAACHPHM